MKNDRDIFGFDAQPDILDTYEPNPIDTLDEAAAAVDDILDGVTSEPETDDTQATAAFMLAHYAGMEHRVRMLTWAVVLLAIYIVIKDL